MDISKYNEHRQRTVENGSRPDQQFVDFIAESTAELQGLTALIKHIETSMAHLIYPHRDDTPESKLRRIVDPKYPLADLQVMVMIKDKRLPGAKTEEEKSVYSNSHIARTALQILEGYLSPESEKNYGIMNHRSVLAAVNIAGIREVFREILRMEIDKETKLLDDGGGSLNRYARLAYAAAELNQMPRPGVPARTWSPFGILPRY
ncbi:hypothetical protein HYX08_02190 [Candidatus Woesearchaeota archaeon]|nr:hypothetical protein [Candidatus Woesearchaeota archaeon]